MEIYDSVIPTQLQYQEVYNFLHIECARVVGTSGPSSSGGSSAAMADVSNFNNSLNRTQLTGLRTALLQKWEKLVVSTLSF